MTEISFTVDRLDVERALRRCRVIGKVYGLKCVTAVIGQEFTKGAKAFAEELGVLLI